MWPACYDKHTCVASVVAVNRCSTSGLHMSIFKLPSLGWSVTQDYLYFTCVCLIVFLTAWFFVSVEFVYVYGCLSVSMVVCVCDRLSAYVSGLVSVLSYIGLLCAYISTYPFDLMSTCVSACVYVCVCLSDFLLVCICMYIWLTTYISICSSV